MRLQWEGCSSRECGRIRSSLYAPCPHFPRPIFVNARLTATVTTRPSRLTRIPRFTIRQFATATRRSSASLVGSRHPMAPPCPGGNRERVGSRGNMLGSCWRLWAQGREVGSYAVRTSPRSTNQSPPLTLPDRTFRPSPICRNSRWD